MNVSSAAAPPAVRLGAPIDVRRVGTLQLAPPDSFGRDFISSASGIVGTGNEAIVISDELHEIARFSALNKPGTLEQVFERQRSDGSRSPVGTKSRKPDGEAIAMLTTPATAGERGHVFAIGFGSGSATTRQRGFATELGRRSATETPGIEPITSREIDLAPLYTFMRSKLPKGLNIEGVAIREHDLLLFHRGGMGKTDRNVIFQLDRAGFEKSLLAGTPPSPELIKGRTFVTLGSLNGVPLGFSDARALPDGRVIFAASAEAYVPAPKSTKRSFFSDPQAPIDGEIRGSAIGVLDAKLGLELLRPLAGRHRKVEGIELVSTLPNLRASRTREPGVDVLLVTDADDPKARSEVLRTRLELPPRRPPT